MAEGGEIGRAWLTIVPSFRGGQSAIEKELGGVGGKAGKTAGAGFMGGLGKAAGTAAKIAGGAAALVGGAIAGVALKGGFDRALNIEAAQAKLSGLGHDAQSVTKIMDNASAAVKGTAFGMGDAAGAAASMVAAGIKPGQDLQKTLTLVGDAASIAGTDFNSMSAIFGKVAASNKLQGDTIAQLHDAGIPALQLVAKEMGVTAEEASAMASKGEVDFATFQRAMQEGMGGAALKSGETFTGAMANTKAALGRIGETILTPFLGALTSGANGIIPVFDSINAALKPVMESFGTWLSGIDFAGAFAGIGEVFGQISAVAMPFLTQLGSTFAPLIPQVIALVTNLSPMSLLFQALAPVLPLIGALLQTVAQALSMVLQAVLPIIQQIAGFLIPLFTQLMAAVLPPLIGVVMQVVAAIGPLIQALGPILQGVLTALMPLITTVFGVIQTVITTVLGVVSGIISAFTSLLAGDWAGFWNGISETVSSIWNGIGELASQFFGDLPGKIISALGDMGSLLVNAGKQILDGFLSGLTSGFNAVKDFVGGIGSWIADNKGPKAYDLALLIPAGNWIMDGLGKGIESSMPALGSTLSDVSWMIQNGIDPNLDASIGATASAVPATAARSAASVDPATRGSGVSVKQEIHANNTDEIVQEANGRMWQSLREAGIA